MGIVFALVLLLGFGITWEARASMTASLLARLDERGVSIASDLAAHATDYILINNSYALHELLTDSLRNNTDLRYAFILDPYRRVLVHSFDEGFPRGLAEQNPVAAAARAHVVVLTGDEGPIHDVAVPIFDGRAGFARVGLTEHSARAAVDELTRQMLLTTFAVSLLGVGAAYLLTLILTRPIRALVDVTHAVARGDLTSRVPPWGDDEIGQLSTAFNRMTRELDAAQRAMLRREAVCLSKSQFDLPRVGQCAKLSREE
jgi:HAMP domain-containing protein